VDSNRNELSENNIFLPNRFSGIDYHDYGTRLSYGINSSLLSNHFYVDAFLGQLFHKNNVSESGNSDYVGNATLDLKDNFEIFYRFRRDKELRPIRNEIGIMASAEKFNATTTFTELHNISKYFAKDEFKPEQDKMYKDSVYDKAYTSDEREEPQINPPDKKTVWTEVAGYITDNVNFNPQIDIMHKDAMRVIETRMPNVFDDKYTERKQKWELKRQNPPTYTHCDELLKKGMAFLETYFLFTLLCHCLLSMYS
jgi:hypothetical protein